MSRSLEARALIVLLALVASTGGNCGSRSQPEPGAAVGAHRSVPPPGSYSHAVFKPLPLFSVRLADEFWRPRIQTNIDRGWFDLRDKFESAGSIGAFRIVAEGRDAPAPRANNDEFVYKWMEAGGLYAGYPDCGAACARIGQELQKMIDLALSAQTPEGYINTYYGNKRMVADGHTPWNPKARYEFYNFGHLTQAAIATYRATGDRRLLDAVVRFGDLIVSKFSAPVPLPYERPDHPNHEMAMVELYRVTGNRRYLDFVSHTYDHYDYWPRTEVRGHAVQDALLHTGAVELYLETGDRTHLETPVRLWEEMVSGKMYVTGGIGSYRKGEAFGGKYDLPNDGYAETCAAISSFFWAHRLLLATGDGRYGDLMERLMYNSIISGISLSGTEYFYRNPLVFWGQDDSNERIGPRKPWFGAPGPAGTPCCPPNVSRFLASLADYFYAADRDRVVVNLYGANIATLPVAESTVSVTQTTDYPWDGNVRITVTPERPVAFSLYLRVPDWTQGRPLPLDLYRYAEDSPGAVRVLVNDQAFEVGRKKGFLVVSREWRRGDVVKLNLPMPVRRVLAHEGIAHLKGHVAVERGPVVYCFEGIDHGGRALNLVLPDTSAMEPEFRPDLLGGVAVVRGAGLAVEASGTTRQLSLTAIPYALWENRGSKEMTVWLPRDPAGVRPQAHVPQLRP